jgi:protease IV
MTEAPQQHSVQPEGAPATPSRTSQQQLGKYAFLLFVGVPAGMFWLGVVVLVMLIASIAGAIEGIATHWNDDEQVAACNVARVQLHGVLMVSDSFSSLLSGGMITDADSVARSITAAEEDPDIAAIVLDVNSPGGTPVAGDEILSAVMHVTTKPVVAVVRDVGASAAYWAIAGADHIIASPMSDVGSIGVTMSYAESAGALNEEGGRWVDIASGAFKDAGNPERTLRQEEQEYFQAQVDSVHEYMVERILFARPMLASSTLSEIADGRAFLGVDALAYGLVDVLGGFDTALAYIDEQTGTEAALCDPLYGAPWWFF